MSIKEKPSSMQKGLDLFYTYKILKDLVTPFDEMYPFKLGLIDADGKRLKKAKSTEEKKAMPFYNRMIINMKRLLIGLLLMSFLTSADVKEVGRYQLAVSTYESKKGKIYIVETVLDTKTGKVVKRKRIYHTKYKLPYKNDRGKTIYEE